MFLDISKGSMLTALICYIEFLWQLVVNRKVYSLSSGDRYNSNPDNATAICGLELKTAKLACALIVEVVA